MIPFDAIRYYLPDGTLVAALCMSSGEWKLETENGTPLYYTSNGVFHRLEYHEDEDAYRLVPTNLTFDDLLIAD